MNQYKGLDFKPRHKTDDKSTQRGLAQMLNDKYKPPLDKIRDVDPNNPKIQEYNQFAKEFLRRLREGK